MEITLNMVVFAEDAGVLDVSLRRVARHTRQAPMRLWVQGGCTPEVHERCREFAAARGDTDVVVSRKNIGHGPALDRLWEMCETPYFLCFDMDSFPVADGWLEDLEAKVDAGASCAGVIERAVGRRNRWGEYVHPSCLLIGKDEFESLRHPRHGLRFGGFSPTRADVGEMITVRIMRTGRRYDGWKYTHSRFPDEVRWGFRHYGGYWCHIWMVSQLAGQKRWHGRGDARSKTGTAWVYGLHGVTPERYGELMETFLAENA